MSVAVNIPEVELLRQKVETSYGKPLETHNSFIALVDAIETTIKEHLSESTLERMWGYSTREAEAISLRTLDVLSRYVGSTSWKGFCANVKKASQIESEEFKGDSLVSSHLQAGARLKLGWLPNRLITVQYLGRQRFVVLESLNSSLKPGDSFDCIQIQTGRPLYLDRFRRAGSDTETRYVAGERNGLTLVQTL